MMPARQLIYTDLDGTLLDHHNYSVAGAEPALAEIERRRIPLILVTSKTRAEVEVIRRKLGHGHPFITENGGGIFIPDGYFQSHIDGAIRAGRYFCIPLARPYSEIIQALDELSEETSVSVVGFHHMSAREIAQNTGLSLQEAEYSRQREFDEPFFFAGATESAIHTFAEAARLRKLTLMQGGRFWHLCAGSDKGRAVRHLTKLYRDTQHIRFRTIGLGDSPNDIPLFAAVDRAVLLPDSAGTLSPEVESRFPRIIRAAQAGPHGWNLEVLKLLATN